MHTRRLVCIFIIVLTAAMLCRFAQFPDLRQLRQLAVLHMHDNSVGRLPSSIGELVNLVTLDMGENSLTEIRCVLIHVSVSHSYTPTRASYMHA